MVSTPQQRDVSRKQIVAVIAAIAPLLLPLQAFSEEQISAADAGVASPEIIRFEI